MAYLHKLLLSALLAACAACAYSGTQREDHATGGIAAEQDTTASLKCATNAECVVKDIGNCCGYFPACVHRDQAVDPLAVRERCIEQDLQSICGFVEISACACIDNACRPADAGGAVK